MNLWLSSCSLVTDSRNHTGEITKIEDKKTIKRIQWIFNSSPTQIILIFFLLIFIVCSDMLEAQYKTEKLSLSISLSLISFYFSFPHEPNKKIYKMIPFPLPSSHSFSLSLSPSLSLILYKVTYLHCNSTKAYIFRT